jgi:hypothetical protein
MRWIVAVCAFGSIGATTQLDHDASTLPSEPSNGRCWGPRYTERHAAFAASRVSLFDDISTCPQGQPAFYRYPLCSGQSHDAVIAATAERLHYGCNSRAASRAGQTSGSTARQPVDAYRDIVVAAIVEDSRGWSWDRLVSGSIRPESVSWSGDVAVVSGYYSVTNGFMGNSTKTFAVQLVAGRVSCIEYSSFPGVCNPIRPPAGTLTSQPGSTYNPLPDCLDRAGPDHNAANDCRR